MLVESPPKPDENSYRFEQPHPAQLFVRETGMSDTGSSSPEGSGPGDYDVRFTTVSSTAAASNASKL